MLGTIDITIEGKKIPLIFNNWALFSFLDEFKLDPGQAATIINEIQEKEGNLGVVKVIVKHGDVGYCKENKIARRLNEDDIHKYVSSGNLHEMFSVISEFTTWCLAVMPDNSSNEKQDGQKQDDKKKQRKTEKV